MNDEIPDRVRSTKIVATLGNVSSSPEMLTSLTAAGVNVFRLNFSHGTREEQGLRIDAIRALEAKTGVLGKLPKVQSFRLMSALLLIWIQKREMPILLAYRMRKFLRRYIRVHVC